MKSIFLLLSFSASVAVAQISNSGFESVYMQDSIIRPSGWGFDPIGSASTTDAHTGQYAVEVWNWYSYAKGYVMSGTYPTTFPATIPGEAFAGFGGTPVSGKPLRLTGFYKSDPGEVDILDSGLVQITAKKYNATTQQTEVVGFGKTKLPAASVYTPFSVDIVYSSVDIPDSVAIVIYSSEAGYCNVSTCHYMKVDDLALVFTTGTEPVEQPFSLSVIYPNPSDGHFRIDHTAVQNATQLCVYNTSGSLVKTYPVLSAITPVDLSGTDTGMYFFFLSDANGKLLDKGKMVVSK